MNPQEIKRLNAEFHAINSQKATPALERRAAECVRRLARAVAA